MKLFGWDFAFSYTLIRDLIRDTTVTARGGFFNRWLKIVPTAAGSRIIVFRRYTWDGNTGVPNPPGSYDGSALHDAIYQFAEEIAKAWGCTVGEVLEYGNLVYGQVLREDKCPVAGLYAGAVGIVGAPYHYARRWIRSWFV